MILYKSRPNGFRLVLECEGDLESDSLSVFVTETGDEDGVEFDSDIRAAWEYFCERETELASTPNWEAQARYDEEHGTDNGYDPRIEAWRNEY